jgi:2-polyprenyl-3-methyl-5-hydroxy-6-metoxy-1,4-benzoquinol methylase
MENNMISKKCRKNKFGFYEILNKPSSEELKKYYAEKYYQNDKGTYCKKYNEDEVKNIMGNIKLKHFLFKENLKTKNKYKILDVGCGEGFALKYFDELGWDILGVDFSSHGCKTHNPKYLERIIIGDIYDVLHNIKNSGKLFDVVWLDSVLEHVLDPLSLLRICYELGGKGSWLMVEVPNDFSVIQKTALGMGFIDNKFWIASPDHISYFNKQGLKNIAKEAGWSHKISIGNFPIDFNLFNDESNYIRNPEKGKACHRQRLAIERILCSMPTDKVINFYQALGGLGMGRHIVAVFTK